MGARWQDQLDAVLRQPRGWLLQADAVKRAADLVGSQFQAEASEWVRTAAVLASSDASDTAAAMAQARAFELALPAYMLVGYAIEVAAKGVIVSRDDSEPTIRWLTRNHLSIELLERAGVPLEPWEEMLVRRLRHAVRWSGRYPAPNRPDAITLDEEIAAAGGSVFSDPRAMSTDFYRQACELFDRLRADLVAAMTPAP